MFIDVNNVTAKVGMGRFIYKNTWDNYYKIFLGWFDLFFVLFFEINLKLLNQVFSSI